MISFYKRMDYLVTVNPVFIDKLEAYGIPGDKITYIPNMVSEKNFYPLKKEEKEKIREKYGFRPEAFVIFCRNVNLYGQEDFLLERFLKDMKKSKHEWSIFRKMSGSLVW